VDEAWLFNVLEHVIDPTEIINLCKKNCKIIRFFEPDGHGGKDAAHPHCITFDYLESQFGEGCVKRYVGGTVKKNFHGANCSYGVWIK
jgi:2-polyprenyl-3-methyl-5-hydroxy-6-metoxy-1,4-benzoquinol methylase